MKNLPDAFLEAAGGFIALLVVAAVIVFALAFFSLSIRHSKRDRVIPLQIMAASFSALGLMFLVVMLLQAAAMRAARRDLAVALAGPLTSVEVSGVAVPLDERLLRGIRSGDEGATGQEGLSPCSAVVKSGGRPVKLLLFPDKAKSGAYGVGYAHFHVSRHAALHWFSYPGLPCRDAP